MQLPQCTAFFRAKLTYEENLYISLRHLCHWRGTTYSALPETNRNAESYVLLQLEAYLLGINGRKLSDYEFPEKDRFIALFNSSTNEAAEAEQVAVEQKELQVTLSNLNKEQKLLFNTIVGDVHPDRFGRMSSNYQMTYQTFHMNSSYYITQKRSRPWSATLFLDAPGVVGKTCVIIAIGNCLEVQSKSFIALATSPIAAKLMKRNTTAHSAFRIPVQCIAEDTRHIYVDSNNAQKLQKVSSNIWDEIVVSHSHCIKVLDSILKHLTEYDSVLSKGIIIC